MNDKELIWVPGHIAEKHKKMNDKNHQEQLIIDHMESVQLDYKAYIETLDEDVLMFKGAMARIKKEFREAEQEQLAASEAIWDDFQKRTPSITKKVEMVRQKIAPIKKEIESLNKSVSEIDFYGLEKAMELMERYDGLSNDNKIMLAKIIEAKND